jgi:hypothetical protein
MPGMPAPVRFKKRINMLCLPREDKSILPAHQAGQTTREDMELENDFLKEN